jgi:hypothetical protein
MLIQFTVGNFLSFKERTTLSMVKSALHELPENTIKASDNLELLKSAVIYGANASGKSNFLKALVFMRFFAISSFKAYEAEEEIRVPRFILNEDTKDKPSFFEVVFMVDGVTYRYGFEVDATKVRKEWLFHIVKTTEEQLFMREGLDFNMGKQFSEGEGLNKKTRDNCLFLSVVSQFNGEVSTRIIKWFRKIRVSGSRDYKLFLDRTVSRLEEDSSLRDDVAKFISIADNGVENFEIEPGPAMTTPISGVPQVERKDLKRTLIYFIHKVFNPDKQAKDLLRVDFHRFESEGTKKMFALSVPVIDALRNGEILIIDELENHLHPLLFKHIIKLFNSHSNKNNAQLVFATHNLTCMNNECFRRDQIWFTEKNSFGESALFSLADYKLNDAKVRKDASYSKDYLLGKYGAVPFVDDVNLSFEENK